METRAARKRANSNTEPIVLNNKKQRVVLGELPNFPDLNCSENLSIEKVKVQSWKKPTVKKSSTAVYLFPNFNLEKPVFDNKNAIFNDEQIGEPKYEEISPPKAVDFCKITDNTYQLKQVIKMEADILKSLNFEMGNPHVYTFLKEFMGFATENQKTSSLSDNLGYKSNELEECVLILHDLYLSRRAASLKAVREKYKQHKFKSVANLPSPPEVPNYYFEEE
ncbi:hypothetical protein TSUD_316480 [Trifolium subterraneum]|uniref:B-like cyclin n=1 Tax=Trifolium subterraneum TaxID=3900 RepID=A0A2Z6NIT6_TRISU|nr:hypothetical protein TSUD_316480 [Trifolium subterraneum]